MILTAPAAFGGTLPAIPAKAHAHRLLICAALSDAPSEIVCPRVSQDILATAECLRGMGASLRFHDGRFSVRPIDAPVHRPVHLCCRESGSTLRFLLPLCGAIGQSACFHLEGRLPQRPIMALVRVLCANGMDIRKEGYEIICRGKLRPGTYEIAGNVSSQFLSGLLFALPLLPGGSKIRLTTPIVSRRYLDLTLEALRQSGVRIEETPLGFTVPGSQRLRLPGEASVEGDWSDAAVFLCAAAIAGEVTITGLNAASVQGDRDIYGILKRFGANVSASDDGVTVSSAPLHGIEIDAEQIPDLVPPIAAVAAAAEGETRITGAARLRLKESDRLSALYHLLRDLGGDAEELPDGLLIRGTKHLRGGSAAVRGDHRIAMAAALCSLLSDTPVTIDDPSCVSKSHPDFWTDFSALLKEAEA